MPRMSALDSELELEKNTMELELELHLCLCRLPLLGAYMESTRGNFVQEGAG